MEKIKFFLVSGHVFFIYCLHTVYIDSIKSPESLRSVFDLVQFFLGHLKAPCLSFFLHCSKQVGMMLLVCILWTLLNVDTYITVV